MFESGLKILILAVLSITIAGTDVEARALDPKSIVCDLDFHLADQPIPAAAFQRLEKDLAEDISTFTDHELEQGLQEMMDRYHPEGQPDRNLPGLTPTWDLHHTSELRIDLQTHSTDIAASKYVQVIGNIRTAVQISRYIMERSARNRASSISTYAQALLETLLLDEYAQRVLGSR